MKNRIRILLTVLMLLLATVLITSCGDESPYASYGNVVTVEYDANGGTFTTNTSVVKDSYRASDLPKNRFGNYMIPLIDPNDSVRGEENAFLASKSGYFLVGWYAELPVINENGQALDADGNVAAESGKEPAYTYKKWDFENDYYELEAKSYESDESVLRLVAKWLPEFSFEFYDLDTGKLISDYKFDPMYVSDIKLPEWDAEDGKLDMHDFPEVEGKTFKAAYYDPHGINRIDTESVAHTGEIDGVNATAEGSVMKLYVDMNDGAWYNIYTAEQFVEAKDLSGNYNILADLDFSEEGWVDEFISGEFTGTIRGNGHTFKNITYAQSSASDTNAGLFGSVSADAMIEDVTFENLDFTIETGSRMTGASFGIFAGVLADGAVLDNVYVNGKMTVTPTPYITKSTTIGLFCGTGNPGEIDITGIRCVALPPESEFDTGLALTVDGNTVTVEVIPAEEE